MMDSYFEDEELPKLYHGTTDEFEIDTLYPACETNNLREENRHDLLDYVFLTCSYVSALRYAIKASKKYGGNPIVYTVEPSADCFHWQSGQYLCKSAKIKERIEIEK